MTTLDKATCDTCGGEVTDLVWPRLPTVFAAICETVLDSGNALLLPCGHADGCTPPEPAAEAPA